jgi:hypothetical protein
VAFIANKLAVPISRSISTGLAEGIADDFDPVSLFANGETGAFFDPSDATTVFQDSAATTPALATNPVGCIQDKSGNGLHLTQTTAGFRPTLTVDSSGKTYLARDGVDDLMISAASVSLSAPYTIVHAAMFSAGADNGNRALFGVYLNSTNYFLAGCRQDTGSVKALVRADSTSGTSVVGTMPVGSWLATRKQVCITTLRSNTVMAMRTNGGAESTVAISGTYGPVASCRLQLAQNNGTATTFSAIRDYGMLAINRELTATEIARLTRYFNRKMGN